MTLADGILSGLAQSMDPGVFAFILMGALFGLVIGIIPGLSGHFALAMAVTFLYGMDPAPGIAFLLAAHATVAQGGALTAILFSTPGTGQNAATLLDGPRMRENGEAGIAVGAAMTACFLGATFGAIVLAFLIPVLREIVLLFGPPEIFILAAMGLIFVAVLGQRDLLRSLIAGLFGLFLSMIGLDNATNASRFSMGLDQLVDGLSLVPVVLGLFAVAEMISLWRRGGSFSGDRIPIPKTQETRLQFIKGIRLAFQKWWLVLRSSAIGTIMGIIPGLGSASASFVAYGHARQSSQSPETFGRGNVEGVIAPEAANDAVEGGALSSTVAFGIPGSSSMAILLSGLAILGLETGPRMLNENVDVIFLMIFTIILGNLIGTIGGLFVANPLVRATGFRSTLMVPVVIAVMASGAYASQLMLFDIGIALVFGVVGFGCMLLRYSRAALLIGFVLGFPVEYNLNLALQLDGPLFFLEPIPLVLSLFTLAFLAVSIRSLYRRSRDIPAGSGVEDIGGDVIIGPSPERLRIFEYAALAVLAVIVALAIWETLGLHQSSFAIPMVVLFPLAFLLLLQAGRLLGTFPGAQKKPADGKSISPRAKAYNALSPLLMAFALLVPLIFIGGHYPAIFLFMIGLMWIAANENLNLALIVSFAVTVCIYFVFDFILDVDMYNGIIFRYFSGFRDF